MSARLLALAAVLAGCSAPDLALRPVSARSAPPVDTSIELPEAYEVLDVSYASSLVALDEDPDLADIRERATVQVFARHRQTGEEVLFVFDLTRTDGRPVHTVRFQRVAEDAPEPQPVRAAPERRW